MTTKILLYHLKEVEKQHLEVYYKIFKFVLLREIFSPKSLSIVVHIELIFNPVNNV